MEAVRVLAPHLVLVDWGPMTLTISAWAGGRPRPVMAAQAARRALACLAELADFQNYLKRRAVDLPPDRPLPAVVARALAGARLAPGELTPLAAVAGAVADEVADRTLELGADKVIVNNGGDIALRLLGRRRALVGLKPPDGPDGSPAPLLGRLRVSAGMGLGGVASSGWQGRSLSPGVADLVTVWAADAATADAAATLIADQVDVDCPAVLRAPARELDPDSDLGSRLVTRQVGQLTPAQRLQALTSGLKQARGLHAAGAIAGCLVYLQGELALLPGATGCPRLGLYGSGRVPPAGPIRVG